MSFQILGILGQAGSGKDVVADWFYQKGYVKLAFSDPMKRYVQELFGYSIEQLWGVSELRNKDMVADDPWWMGVAANWGKATNKFVNEMFSHTFSNGHIGRVDAYVSLMQWFTGLRIYSQKHALLLSPRIVLQTLGTEWGRKLDDNLWVNYAYDRIIPELMKGTHYDRACGLGAPNTMTGCPGVFITDHRFYNEVLATRQHDGFVLRVSRPGRPVKDSPGLQGHLSENEQLTAIMPISYELELPEGLDKVDERLKKLWEDKPWENR